MSETQILMTKAESKDTPGLALPPSIQIAPHGGSSSCLNTLCPGCLGRTFSARP
jgi:hypothetical protein